MSFGREYILPVPFDKRLMTRVPVAIAEAAMKSGVAQKPIADMDAYRKSLSERLERSIKLSCPKL
jgi:malate dehydrogenase (oxaloacetate-decarboxylating)(NADP+)